MAREAVQAKELPAPIGPFSPAVKSGDTLYVSGHVAQDPATGKLIEGGVAEQTERVLQNVAAVLGAARKSLSDVVSARVYLVDMADFAAMNAVYTRHFKAPYPARTTIAVLALPMGAKVEIELIAR
jgi:2-iminobutanoate/2-iminopropanoate deaminase